VINDKYPLSDYAKEAARAAGTDAEVGVDEALFHCFFVTF